MLYYLLLFMLLLLPIIIVIVILLSSINRFISLVVYGKFKMAINYIYLCPICFSPN